MRTLEGFTSFVYQPPKNLGNPCEPAVIIKAERKHYSARFNEALARIIRENGWSSVCVYVSDAEVAVVFRDAVGYPFRPESKSPSCGAMAQAFMVAGIPVGRHPVTLDDFAHPGSSDSFKGFALRIPGKPAAQTDAKADPKPEPAAPEPGPEPSEPVKVIRSQKAIFDAITSWEYGATKLAAKSAPYLAWVEAGKPEPAQFLKRFWKPVPGKPGEFEFVGEVRS